MLAVSLETLQPVPYQFCRTQACPIVYFSIDSHQTFREAQLREPVYQKHLSKDDVFVCYCFRYTLGMIQAELAANGKSLIIEQIKAGIKANQCACDIRNPQGDCCLGNVILVIKHSTEDPTLTT